MWDKLLELRNPLCLIAFGLIIGLTFYYREIDFICLFIGYSILAISSIHFKKNLFFVLGISSLCSYCYCNYYIKTPDYSFLLNKKEIYICEVLSKEQKNNFYIKYFFKVKKIVLRDKSINTNFKVLAQTATYEELEPGDIIQIKGNLKTPKSATFPGLFDKKKYLFLKGTYYELICSNGSIVYLNTREKSLITKLIDGFRLKVLFENSKNLPKDNADILNGIVIGSKASPLNKDLKEKFQSLGLSHITSASGFNLSILAFCIFFLFSIFLKREKLMATIITLLGITGYSLIAECSSSIIRAGLFLTLVLFGNLFNKRVKILPTISLIIIIFFITSPLSLLDIGFQLSVFSFLGLTLFLEDINTLTSEKINKLLRPITSVFFETLFAQLMVLPIVLLYFHNIQIMGLVSNIIAVPLSSIILITGLLNTVFIQVKELSLLSLTIYKFLHLLTNLFLLWINFLCSLSINGVFIPKIDFYSAIFLYGLIIFTFLIISNKRKQELSAKFILMFLIALLINQKIKDDSNYLKILCIPKYNQENILVLPPNETPVLFSTKLDKSTKSQTLYFLKLFNYQKSFIFYNLKDNNSLISESKYIKDLKNKIIIEKDGFKFEIIKNYRNKIDSKSAFIKLPILMKKDPVFIQTFKSLPENIIVNNCKKLSKSSTKNIAWLKKQKTNLHLLNNSGTITIVIKNKNNFQIDREY